MSDLWFSLSESIWNHENRMIALTMIRKCVYHSMNWWLTYCYHSVMLPVFLCSQMIILCFIISWGSGSQPGVHVPLGVREKLTGGTQNKKTLKRISQKVCKIKKKHPKDTHLGKILDLGVRKGEPTLILGYAECENVDLGVRGYQKVENPCPEVSILWMISLT
jgi:hypothetical protein